MSPRTREGWGGMGADVLPTKQTDRQSNREGGISMGASVTDDLFTGDSPVVSMATGPLKTVCSEGVVCFDPL